MMRRLLLAGFILALPSLATAQDTSSKTVARNLKKYIYYLASDKLQGRLTATKYERKAGDFIAKQFKKDGLLPKGDSGYFQTFTVTTGWHYGPNNELQVADKGFAHLDAYRPGKFYYPLAYSANGDVSGPVIDAKKARHTRNTILLVKMDKSADPHSQEKTWRDWVRDLRQYSPSAILFYNLPDSITIDAMRAYNNRRQEDLVLVCIGDSILEKIEKTNGASIRITVDMQKETGRARNVIGYIDNNAPGTIVLGAHYDHLGHNEYMNSLYRGPSAIHNGADDNASGTAAIVELGRIIHTSGKKNHNYLFVAFSGEELGLLGSNYFTKHPTIPDSMMDAMINMDMVGRLDSTKKELGINGVGTSPAWDSLMREIKGFPDLHIKTTQSGMGNSDHSSFYLKDIPAIHFFTGNHKDYHKPTDDAKKINYRGEAEVIQYIYTLTELLDKHPRLKFTRTKEDSTNTPHFKVTLGIIPDYFFDGQGVRVDGISPGKSAEKAGLKQGDIIVKLGTFDVRDMMTYMEALGKFSKGEETSVIVKRGDETLTFPVKF